MGNGAIAYKGMEYRRYRPYGHGAHRQWGNSIEGYGVQGVGYMFNGQGIWGTGGKGPMTMDTWAMGYRGIGTHG